MPRKPHQRQPGGIRPNAPPPGAVIPPHPSFQRRPESRKPLAAATRPEPACSGKQTAKESPFLVSLSNHERTNYAKPQNQPAQALPVTRPSHP